MKQLFCSCLVLLLIVLTIGCRKQHYLCEDIKLIEKFEKGGTNKNDRVKEAIARIEKLTKIECPQEGTLLGVMYYPDSITINLWKKSLETKEINCD